MTTMTQQQADGCILGLEEACDAAQVILKQRKDKAEHKEGRAALAFLIGISKQAVSAWVCVPSDRVVDVEKLTGVPRKTLRPDLYE